MNCSAPVDRKRTRTGRNYSDIHQHGWISETTLREKRSERRMLLESCTYRKIKSMQAKLHKMLFRDMCICYEDISKERKWITQNSGECLVTWREGEKWSLQSKRVTQKTSKMWFSTFQAAEWVHRCPFDCHTYTAYTYYVYFGVLMLSCIKTSKDCIIRQ